jgi:hypothetical protein
MVHKLKTFGASDLILAVTVFFRLSHLLSFCGASHVQLAIMQFAILQLAILQLAILQLSILQLAIL